MDSRLSWSGMVLAVAAALLLAVCCWHPWVAEQIRPADAGWIVFVASIAGATGALFLALHEARVRAALRGNVPAARVVSAARPRAG